MQKLLFVFSCLFVICLTACRPDAPPQQINIHASFTNLKNEVIKEVSSGETVIITSARFANINPNGLSPNQVQMYFDNTPVSFQPSGANSIIAQVPVMNLYDYKSLIITIRYDRHLLKIIEKLIYRPTVTGEVLAGNDETFLMPAEMTIDNTGILYVIDQRPTNDVILKVMPDGTTSMFSGMAAQFGRLVGIGINSANTKLYVADATSQQVKMLNISSPATVSVLAGSGTAGNVDGTGAAASFRFGNESVSNFSSNEKGQGLHVDGLENIYVGERYEGSEFNSQVRKITAAGVVTTVPGSRVIPGGLHEIRSPAGVTLSPDNKVVWVGGGSSLFQGMVRVESASSRIDLAGKVSNESLKDGTGAAAEFTYPKAVTYHNNAYYIADGSNGALRKSTLGGRVITLAGVGHFATASYCGCPLTGPKDSSYVMPSTFDASPDKHLLPATAIRMDQVGGVAVKNPGLIYVSDYGANYKCIWRIKIE